MQEQPEQSEVRPITTPSAYVSDSAQAVAVAAKMLGMSAKDVVAKAKHWEGDL